jgi:hypothetical protein
VSSDRKQAQGGLSVSTLMIASASSLVAALVVSRLWGGGTLFGAALTPVIVAVVSEGLRKPATVVATVRQTRATPVYDPVAEGRRGVAEGDLPRTRPAAPGEAPERRVHRVGPTVPAAAVAAGRAATAPGRSRQRLLLAVATGLVAFVVAGVALTGSELVLGNSVVSSSKRTTYIPVATGKKKSDAKTTTETDAKTTTTDTTGTETTPQPQETTPTTTAAPDAQTPQPNTVPAAPPPEQTAPAPAPAPTPAVPAPTTSTPAPTP